jgi:hypothetical protein
MTDGIDLALREDAESKPCFRIEARFSASVK